MKKTKKEERKKLAEKRIEIIKRFASEMGYTTWEEDYITTICGKGRFESGRPAHIIELSKTADSEGNPYSWAWYTDTWEEM